MKLVFKNVELAPIIEFLNSMKIRASESRHRSKVVKKLVEAFEELQKSQEELQGEFGERNGEGELIFVDGVNVQIKKGLEKAWNDANLDLFNEQVTIDAGMFEVNFRKLKNILNHYDEEIGGRDADAYDCLMTAFENVEGGE